MVKSPILLLLISSLCLILSGCGFHVREATQIPPRLQTLVVDSYDPYGFVTRQVIQELHLNNVTVLDTATNPEQPVLRIIDVTQIQNTASIFGDGKTAEYELVITLKAQLVVPHQGIFPLTATTTRSFFDNPLTALAKDAEQQLLVNEMYQKLAQKIVRDLATLPLADKKLPASPANNVSSSG